MEGDPMRRTFKFYAICWAIFLVLFNVICFVTPNEVAGISKFDGAFWVGYIFITIAFVGQLACAYIAFKDDNLKKLFYNLPLITLSYSGLISTLFFGGLCMAIPNLPKWVGIIVCMLVLVFNVVAVLKASAAAGIVAEIDEQVIVQGKFIKSLAVDADNLVNRAKNDAIKADCKKVYEAIKYSDPVSSEGLSVIEAKITVKMDELSKAVDEGNDEATRTAAEEITALIKERNNKCKALK
jgi:hypothetical protein